MQTLICLGICKMEIDWGKNYFFNDHSDLFSTDDVKKVPYYYPDEIDSDEPEDHVKVEYKEGFSRSLLSIKKRLDLLGYTLTGIESMYNSIVHESKQHGVDVPLSFKAFSNIIKEIDITQVNTPLIACEHDENGFFLGEYARKCIIPEEEINTRLADVLGRDQLQFNNDLECLFENMDPYIVLRLLAENPKNDGFEVYWAYADSVEEGWIKKEDVLTPLPSSKKILIVTEGSTDSSILNKAISVLYPEIRDFFYFIDMADNYPFTGTGNLYNFCCGLSKIGVLNNAIVIFDNDCSGNEKYEKLMTIPKQDNLLIVKLPSRTEFESIETVGPQGTSLEDINGRAVSIECFLDFDSVSFSPQIRWTSYSERMRQYQGALLRKDEYTRAFLNADLKTEGYDLSKIKALVDYIIELWCNRTQ